MNTPDYSTCITAAIAPQKAFEAISNVRGWWSADFEGSAGNVGDVFTVRFGETYMTMAVTESIPGRRIVWLVSASWKHWMTRNQTEWTGTSISFDLTEQDQQTLIRFTHHGLVPACDCFDVCTNVWTGYMHQSLASLITTGTGTPHLQETVA